MRLIPRKRLDIAFVDLMAGLLLCARPRSGSTVAAEVEDSFGGEGINLACLSVRTAFDLALQVLALEPGDEVLMSGFTIPHMVELVRAHGGVPVPVDLDPRTMGPRWDTLERRIGARTRAIVVAHLFGSRFDAGPGVRLAKAHGLTFIEDAAQAFDHSPWRGHPEADLSLFSFGSIKTSTALGGGIAVIRDPALAAGMRALESRYARDSNLSHAARVLRYTLIWAVASPAAYGLMAAALRTVDVDFDGVINELTRSFRGADLCAAVRRRPARAQLELLARRLAHPQSSRARTRARTRAGAQVAGAVEAPLSHLGAEGHSHSHSHWLFPVLCERPEALLEHLRRAGFDATRGGTTLSPVRGHAPGYLPGHLPGPETRALAIERVFEQIVYLPVDGHLRPDELDRLIESLAEYARLPTPTRDFDPHRPLPNTCAPSLEGTQRGARP